MPTKTTYMIFCHRSVIEGIAHWNFAWISEGAWQTVQCMSDEPNRRTAFIKAVSIYGEDFFNITTDAGTDINLVSVDEQGNIL